MLAVSSLCGQISVGLEAHICSFEPIPRGASSDTSGKGGESDWILLPYQHSYPGLHDHSRRDESRPLERELPRRIFMKCQALDGDFAKSCSRIASPIF